MLATTAGFTPATEFGFHLTFHRSSTKLPKLFGIQQELPLICLAKVILLPVTTTGISKDLRTAETG